jgi:N-acetylmuramoyl-L-alanine amidase
MVRIFFLFLVLLQLSYAYNSQTALKEADRLLATKRVSSVFTAYNDYKNLYLRSIIENNEPLRYRALKGIVTSGKLLHIDVHSYEQELSKIGRKPRTQKKQAIRQKYLSAKWVQNKLILRFSKNIATNDINFFTLRQKGYSYIFDINAYMTGRQSFFKKDIKKIQVMRETDKQIRLLIQNKTPLEIHFFLKGKVLQIQIEHTVIGSSKVHSEKLQKVVTVAQEPKGYAPLLANKDKVIVIDPGHGGKDPGATGYDNYHEKNVVLAIGLKLDQILKERGYTVYMTRHTDHFITLRNRTKFANAKHADIFVSIHANAVPYKERYEAYGIETYFLSLSDNARAARVARRENSVDMSDMNYYGKSTFITFITNRNRVASNKLAIDVQSSILRSLRRKYRHVVDQGVREGPFWVLVGAQMPAILIETGFITNPNEAKRLVNPKYQRQFATGIANGIAKYFLLKNR